MPRSGLAGSEDLLLPSPPIFAVSAARALSLGYRMPSLNSWRRCVARRLPFYLDLRPS